MTSNPQQSEVKEIDQQILESLQRHGGSAAMAELIEEGFSYGDLIRLKKAGRIDMWDGGDVALRDDPPDEGISTAAGEPEGDWREADHPENSGATTRGFFKPEPPLVLAPDVRHADVRAQMEAPFKDLPIRVSLCNHKKLLVQECYDIKRELYPELKAHSCDKVRPDVIEPDVLERDGFKAKLEKVAGLKQERRELLARVAAYRAAAAAKDTEQRFVTSADRLKWELNRKTNRHEGGDIPRLSSQEWLQNKQGEVKRPFLYDGLPHIMTVCYTTRCEIHEVVSISDWSGPTLTYQEARGFWEDYEADPDTKNTGDNRAWAGWEGVVITAKGEQYVCRGPAKIFEVKEGKDQAVFEKWEKGKKTRVIKSKASTRKALAELQLAATDEPPVAPPEWVRAERILLDAWSQHDGFRQRCFQAERETALRAILLDQAREFAKVKDARPLKCDCPCESAQQKAFSRGESTRQCFTCNHTVRFLISGTKYACTRG